MTATFLPQDSLQESLAIIYPQLSRGFRRVFQYLQFMSKKDRTVFPSLETIAERCLLSKRQVQRAIQKFIELGWLAKTKRAYQSCCYWLVDCLVKVNLNCRKFFSNPLFTRENVHPNVHVLSSYKEYIDIPGTEGKVPAHKAPEKQPASRPIPEPFKKMKRLNDQHRDKLASTFSDYELLEMLKDASWYKAQGHEIKNLFGFLWSRGKKIAKKMGRSWC